MERCHFPERRGGGGLGREVAPALLSAGLLGLAQPPFYLPGLPFLALVPLAAALGRGAGRGGGGAECGGAGVGAVFALAHWSLELAWIPTVVGRSFSWAFAGYATAVALLTGLGALLGEGVRRMHRSGKVPLPLAFSVGWVAVEWIRGNLPFGLAWPWLGLGLTVGNSPSLMVWAGWIGEAGLSLWLALVNGWIAVGILRLGERAGGMDWRQPAVPLVGAAGGALLPFWLGSAMGLADPEPRGGSGPRVAVVGTDVRWERGRSPEEEAWEAVEQVGRALEGLPPGAVDLVILPEGTVRVPLNLPAGAPFRAKLEALARDLRAPLLIGAILQDLPGEGTERSAGGRRTIGLKTNSAVLILPGGSIGPEGGETGRAVGSPSLTGGFSYRYDKVRLVPGMEWGGFRRGVESGVLSLGGWKFGVLICYESLFVDLAGSLRREGAQYLVNLTSDRWLGTPGRAWGRWFLEQHPPHLAMRAVENRAPAVRAANTGVSMAVDRVGRQWIRQDPGMGLLVVRLPPPLPPPWWSSLGGDVGFLALALGLVIVLLRGKPA